MLNQLWALWKNRILVRNLQNLENLAGGGGGVTTPPPMLKGGGAGGVYKVL